MAASSTNITLRHSHTFGDAPRFGTPRLFTSATTYNRPATAYIALRQILGKHNFTSAMQQIQRDYRGSSITKKPSSRPASRLHA